MPGDPSHAGLTGGQLDSTATYAPTTVAHNARVDTITATSLTVETAPSSESAVMGAFAFTA